MTEPLDLETLLEKINIARREVIDIAAGRRRWTMSIPARPDDSDLLLCDALTAAEAKLAALQAIAQQWREHADEYDAEMGRSTAMGITLRWCAKELDKLLPVSAQDRTIHHAD